MRQNRPRDVLFPENRNHWVGAEERVLSSEQLSQLWQKHADALLLIARGHCRTLPGAAEDCVQEAFIRLATQEPVPEVPVAWLVKTVRNAAIDAIRSQHRRVTREQMVARQRQVWLEPVDTCSLDQPSTQQIQYSLQQLDDVTRDIVVSHLWNDMTFRQIAAAFEMSHATVHRRYEAGIEQLRVQMKPDLENEPTTTGARP